MSDLYIDLMDYLEKNYPHEHDLTQFVNDCQNGNVPEKITIAIQLYDYNYLNIIDEYLDFLDYVA